MAYFAYVLGLLCAVLGIRVFRPGKKVVMYALTIGQALNLARDQYGCIALNKIITVLENPLFRNQLLDVAACNALSLSKDDYGNFVIQHVLDLNDRLCTDKIANKLRRHCVELSFHKQGSYIVEKLLEDEVSWSMVVRELLDCAGPEFRRLATHAFGNFVLGKALRVTQGQVPRADFFRDLVQKISPFRQFLPGGSSIPRFLGV